MEETRFLVLFGSEAGERMARIAIESLRAFGGPLSDAPVWAFVLEPARATHALHGLAGVQCIPLGVEEPNCSYPFAAKAAAFAQAEEMAGPVESFADGQTLRPCLNTHCFALNPALGVAPAWWAQPRALIDDDAFQAGPCAGELHRIFLHQAILSALVAKLLAWERLRLLPPEYNFPLHLLHEMPPALRPRALNSLVNAVYEDAFPWGAIEVEEPLRTWLRARLPA